ncbi:Sec-independent protein translocase protein TatB [Methylobacterium nonmethylotrophicum]|uniref:Sec-independent protein translocase protein TatB n=1 Tax=Methylobacterium nonmethylotrophicum TaxID=1141884 RepID=A0A4Z0NYY0_9HYPH|nr:Sec-independent protein translocase protein TatB [Methylobacterium nonmethylotrophicum]TGE01926.1 twin-arginine translocase subunit TatB [Methylobacterium nonmethylotrophicum]
MFDMSWGEVMLIGGVALVVIGPKDLPRALRTVGQVTAKLKRMAGEFQSQFSEAMREAELDDVRREVEGINRSVASAGTTGFNPVQTIRNELKSAVDGVPKPATLPMPSSDPLASADLPMIAPPEPAHPAPPAVPTDPATPAPAPEKPTSEALAAATAQLKADAARVADAARATSAPPHDVASTGHTP